MRAASPDGRGTSRPASRTVRPSARAKRGRRRRRPRRGRGRPSSGPARQADADAGPAEAAIRNAMPKTPPHACRYSALMRVDARGRSRRCCPPCRQIRRDARDLYPRSSPTRRACSGSTAATRCTGRKAATRAACRWCSCMAARVPGATPAHRRFFDPTYYRIVDPRPARRRPLDAAWRDRRQHDAAAGRGHRGAAQAPRHRPLARVRRLVGLDPGAGLCRGASERMSAPWCCAASSCAARARSTGSSTASATSSRRRGAPSPASCRRPSAATCSNPTTGG